MSGLRRINVVLRTCDRVSLCSDRIVPKDQCVIRCLKSLIDSLDSYGNYIIHIVDDNSSIETREAIHQLVGKKGSINFLEPRDQKDLNAKQKSRYSVKVAYDYVLTLPDDELVYIVEDDYLHYPDSINKMIEAWEYFTVISNGNIDIGIFPQDFVELYFHPRNDHNSTYVKPCFVLPGPDRYYRTTWFTHESFMVRVGLIKKHIEEFEKLLLIGNDENMWEGLSLSNVWTRPDVKMLMPLGTLAIHVSKHSDISFFCKDFDRLWQENEFLL